MQRTLFHGNHYCRNRLVIHSICKTRLVTHSTRLTTSSTGTVVLCLLTCSTHLSARNTRLSIYLSICSTCLPTRITRPCKHRTYIERLMYVQFMSCVYWSSTICRSFITDPQKSLLSLLLRDLLCIGKNTLGVISLGNIVTYVATLFST